MASTVLCIVLICWEGRQLRRSGKHWNIGWSPFGGKASIMAVIWISVVVLSLVDFQSGEKLFVNISMLDQSYRVNWVDDILRTGIPPVNSLYFYRHPATMRYYYFWYAVCAVVSRVAHLSARSAFTSSCVWAGMAITTLIGLYLKHFLSAVPGSDASSCVVSHCSRSLDSAYASISGGSSSAIRRNLWHTKCGLSAKSPVGLVRCFGLHTISQV